MNVNSDLTICRLTLLRIVVLFNLVFIDALKNKHERRHSRLKTLFAHQVD